MKVDIVTTNESRFYITIPLDLLKIREKVNQSSKHS